MNTILTLRQSQCGELLGTYRATQIDDTVTLIQQYDVPSQTFVWMPPALQMVLEYAGATDESVPDNWASKPKYLGPDGATYSMIGEAISLPRGATLEEIKAISSSTRLSHE